MENNNKISKNGNEINSDICCRWISINGKEIEIERHFDTVQAMEYFCTAFEKGWYACLKENNNN